MKKIRKPKVRAVRSAKKRGSRPTLHSPTTAAPNLIKDFGGLGLPECFPDMSQVRNHVTVGSPPYIVGEIPGPYSVYVPDRTLSQMEYAQSKFVAPMGFWARMWAKFGNRFGNKIRSAWRILR